MTWIKICGITNFEDAQLALDAGADALGFVFYEKSPRYIAPERAAEIAEKLPVNLEKFGVFVDHASQQMNETVHNVGLTAVQFHITSQDESLGQQKNAVVACNGRKKYLALPATFFLNGGAHDYFGLQSLNGVDGLFLDSGTAEVPGGTGKAFGWAEAAPVVEGLRGSTKIVVAGGLTPGNVADAIRILKPWGVDVSSGVEARPGKKDPERVRAFIAAVRQTEKSNS